jgi:hypothetical protein
MGGRGVLRVHCDRCRAEPYHRYQRVNEPYQLALHRYQRVNLASDAEGFCRR